MSKSIEFLNNLAKQLQEQDNLCTASPNYCIQEHTPITGIDEDYTDNIGWFCTDGGWQAEGEELEQLEAQYDEDSTIPDGWVRTGYDRDWKYTGISFLTREAAKQYVANMKHKHRYEIRVYVDSHYYNPEMREVRRLMAGPVQACIESLRQMVAMMDEGDEHGAGSEWHTQAKAAMEALDTAKEPHQ